MKADPYTVINSHITNLESQLFTSLPATVISYDAVTQTITALPVMLEAYKDGDVSEFPEIDNVPVIFPSAGGGSLTFPIQVGDEVMLMFSARNFDTWWTTSATQELSSTQRFHDISDAVAIVGLTSSAKSVNGSTEDVVLKFKDNSIILKKDGTLEGKTTSTIKISNTTEELISLLSETLQAISDITVNTAYGMSPIDNKINILSLKQRLDTFKA